MDYSSSFAMRARAFGQKLGILRPMVCCYRWLLSISYEKRFHDSLLNAIRPGDVVWDVGANVGVYTMLFADRVGPSGTVVAFELSPSPYATLKAAIGGHSNVRLHNVALSQDISDSGTGTTSTTDGLAQQSIQSHAIEVSVERGDSFRSSGLPSVVKVDVEAFELDVLKGMSGLLAERSALRAIFVEVHFLALANRGLHAAPADMIALLRAAGFEIQWIDPSHFCATRTA